LSLATYSDLQSAVASWLDRSDLTSVVPDLITIAETRIFRELRSKDMETSFSTAIASGVIALPTSYVGLKYAYVDGTPTQWLERKPAQWIYQNYPTRAAENKPAFIAREGSNFIFGPYPDSAYTVKGVYYKNIGPLSSSAHAVFTANPDLYLFGSLVEAAPYLKNDVRLTLWEARYQQSLKAAQGTSDREDSSGGSLRMVPG
jgi:hypothetical protein